MAPVSTRLRVLLPTRPPCFIDAAVQYLRFLPAAEAEAELAVLSRDADPIIRATGLRLASEFLPVRGDDMALALLDDPVGFVRWNACELLLHRWCYRAAPRIAELLVNDSSERVRGMAAVSLGTLGDRSVLPTLYEILKTETGVNHEGTPNREAIQMSIDVIRARAEAGNPNN